MKGQNRLDKQEAIILARQMMEFNLKMAQWNKSYFYKNFNINGKGNSPITLRQFHLLLMLHELKVDTLSQLADFFQLSKSSLSLTISKLVKEGYIRKEHPDSTDDGRKMYFYATPKGIEALEYVKNQIVETLSSYYEQLDEEKKEDLKIGLDRLGNVYSVNEEEKG